MGLFNFFRSKTPSPLYIHGDPNSPNHFLSPIPSATDPPHRYRRRRSCNARIPESQRRFVPCRNPGDPSDIPGLGGREDIPEEDIYGGSQHGLGSRPEYMSREDTYDGFGHGAVSVRRGSVRRSGVGGLARAQAHRRATVYGREGRAGSQQRWRSAAIEWNRDYAGYPGSEGVESRVYARSLGGRSTSSGRGRREVGYSGEDSRVEEEERPAVGVFGVANPPYHVPRGQGRGMFAGGWMGVGGRGTMHGRGPFD